MVAATYNIHSCNGTDGPYNPERIAEGLADDRLEIDIRRGLDPDDETRQVFLAGIGPRWADGRLEALR